MNAPAAGLVPVAWPSPARVHAVSTRRAGAGVSLAPFDSFNLGKNAGDDATAVEANRRELGCLAKLPSNPCWLRQVHGVEVKRFTAADAFSEPVEFEADASITSDPGVVLAILTADCLPVLFCADDGSEVAAAHAGWRGLAAGVLEHTLAYMRTAPHRVLAWLGPAAGPQAYEVGAEVRDAFVARDALAATAFVPARAGHWYADLYALARRRLAAGGIEHVYGGGECTISDPVRFFSHRRDTRTGRMATLIWTAG